ncbi:MAG: tetratricopeptide repeat protein [Alphaproteobacteria bacterium]|nr:tetratricopeptide repeat protein [Alphaproteobacteria bacterium SS10]
MSPQQQITQAAQMTPQQVLDKAAELESKGDVQQAIAFYRFLISMDPGDGRALFRLGNLLLSNNMPKECLPYYRVLVELNPNYAPGRINFSIAFKKLGRLNKAIEQLQAVVDQDPDNLAAWQQLADSQRTAENLPEALVAFKRWLELAPDDAKAAHMVKSVEAFLDGNNAGPDRADDKYVASYFDQYAKTFDSHTASVLRYQGPKILKQVSAQAGLLDGDKRDVLDLGCGTGLCGEFLAPNASRLDGIDLSPVMLEEAGKKGIYNELIEGELVSAMEGLEENSYDLAVAGDVFCYIGALEDTFAQVARLVRPQGGFLFTVESMTYNEVDAGAVDHILRHSGRYAQHRDYIERLAAEHGFDVMQITNETLRLEYGKPIAGWMVLLQRLA